MNSNELAGRRHQEADDFSPFTLNLFDIHNPYWAAVRKVDHAGFTQEDERRIATLVPKHSFSSEGQPFTTIPEFLQDVIIGLRTSPQIRVKQTMYAGGRTSVQPGLVSMLARWNNTQQIAMLEEPERITRESALSRQVADRIFAYDFETKDIVKGKNRTFDGSIFYPHLQVTQEYAIPITPDVYAQIPPELTIYDLVNSLTNVAIAGRLSAIAKDHYGLELGSYADFLASTETSPQPTQ